MKQQTFDIIFKGLSLKQIKITGLKNEGLTLISFGYFQNWNLYVEQLFNIICRQIFV